MNNRNMLIFVVLSVLMLGGYNLVMTKVYPPKAVPAQVQTAAAPQAQMPAAQASTAGAALPQGPAADPAARFTLENAALRLTWRKQDGALVQADWKEPQRKDGTRELTPFFPEAKRDKEGKEVSQDFLGLGGAITSRFEGEPMVTATPKGREVTFQNAQGERLTYTVPDQGHVLDLQWLSPRGAALNLMPKPSNPMPVHNLGRVFSIDKSTTAVAWMDMLKDPFTSFLGSKRKDLPPASRRIGMDAGLDTKKATQTTHYFAAIWDASRTTERHLDQAPGFHLAPDATGKVSARLYLGPKSADDLVAFHPAGHPEEGKAFAGVVDFGFFGLVAKLLFMILRGIHSVVPNWGWAIILLTVVIRLALWPLNTKTTVQMLRMKEFEPHQKALQTKYEKFGNDMTKKAEMQKELMAFYKKNGHNPMGGCLPMLLQMPVFFALWSMLNAVFELRHAPFMGWLMDLSAADPYYILPIVMGGTMIAQQAMTPAVGDPTQRKMMMVMMPVMMTFFFASTPSGLVLYYLMFNLIGIFQTWIVMRNYKPMTIIV
jgi:YidC/Oxa1 family membrane protein insertase